MLTESPGPSAAPAGGGIKIEFQFNPKELQFQKKANWKVSPTAGNGKAPPPEYTGPDPASVSVEMFLDATEEPGGDVSKDVQKLFDICIPTQDSETKNKPLPRFVQFCWGAKVYFVGYLESVSAKYTLFRLNGTPIRAICTIALKELPKDVSKQNPTSGTLESQRSLTVVAGDCLAGIAYREHGNPALWRALADLNRIEDPMRLPPGTALLVPSSMEIHQHPER